MQIRHLKLLVSFLIVVALLCGCNQPYSGGAPPPDASEPTTGPEPTATLSSISPTDFPAFTPRPAIHEARWLTLEFPPRIRAGDSDIVRLTLEVDDLGSITPTAQFDDHVVTGEIVQIPNLYESHHVVAESRFDIAGVEVRPTELVSVPLAPGQSATFSWSVRSADAGVYRGTIWLYLRFVNKSNGEESRTTVSAQIVEIEAVNLFGLSGSFARTTGLIGSVVGTIISIPFLEDIIKFFYRRRVKK